MNCLNSHLVYGNAGDFHLFNRYTCGRPEPPLDFHAGKLSKRELFYIMKLLLWNIMLMLWHLAVSNVLGWYIFSQDLHIFANWRRSLVGIIYCYAFVFKKQLPMPKWIVMMQLEIFCCRMWWFIDESRMSSHIICYMGIWPHGQKSKLQSVILIHWRLKDTDLPFSDINLFVVI